MNNHLFQRFLKTKQPRTSLDKSEAIRTAVDQYIKDIQHVIEIYKGDRLSTFFLAEMRLLQFNFYRELSVINKHFNRLENKREENEDSAKSSL